LQQILAVLYSNTTPEEALKPPEEKTEPTPERRFDLN